MFDWNDYLTLARTLERNKADEASQRSAISRAYYAAYHLVTSIVVAEKAILSGSPQHQIWKELQKLGRDFEAADLATLGERGQDLHIIRLRADYHNPFNRENRTWTVETKAADALLLAEEMIRLAGDL